MGLKENVRRVYFLIISTELGRQKNKHYHYYYD